VGGRSRVSGHHHAVALDEAEEAGCHERSSCHKPLTGARSFEEAEATALEIPGVREHVDVLCGVACPVNDGGVGWRGPIPCLAAEDNQEWVA